MDAKPCENQDPPIDEMKLDQPIQLVQVTTMNIARCLAVTVKNKEEEVAQEVVLENAKEVE